MQIYSTVNLKDLLARMGQETYLGGAGCHFHLQEAPRKKTENPQRSTSVIDNTVGSCFSNGDVSIACVALHTQSIKKAGKYPWWPPSLLSPSKKDARPSHKI